MLTEPDPAASGQRVLLPSISRSLRIAGAVPLYTIASHSLGLGPGMPEHPQRVGDGSASLIFPLWWVGGGSAASNLLYSNRKCVWWSEREIQALP